MPSYCFVPIHQQQQQWKKRSERRKPCALAVKAEPKIFVPPQTPRRGTAKKVTTFTYKPTLMRIDACNFELSW